MVIDSGWRKVMCLGGFLDLPDCKELREPDVLPQPS